LPRQSKADEEAVGKRPQEFCDGWQTREVTDICHELGLGPLLEKMPAGMVQMVGETRWQLPNGERSRLYIACALLQRAGILVLYESFAALDPENLRMSLDCVLLRAPTVECYMRFSLMCDKSSQNRTARWVITERAVFDCMAVLARRASGPAAAVED
jgi:hypothetical protein